MKEIIPPIDRSLLVDELTSDKFVRKTNANNNSIYIVSAHNAPNVMQEIGRLRELTFRGAGGGTGKSVDIDEYDTAESPFQQLLVWNDEAKEIVSAYRFIMGKDVPLDVDGHPKTPTTKLFRFSQKFIENQWQQSIELGRSFVQPKYQGTTNPRVGLFSLDNLWDGLGALTVDKPEAKYFFGKMTMYNAYNREARNWVLSFLAEHFKGDPSLVTAVSPVPIDPKYKEMMSVFTHGNFKEDLKTLTENIRNLKENIPPLIKSYMQLSATMQCFGSSENPDFGPVEEIAILISIPDIYEEKIKRHIQSYQKGTY